MSVYRSYILSYISYSSPALLSVPISTAIEMQGVQSRALKIIGLNEYDASKNHGITTVRDYIAHTCVNVLKRILSDTTHPLAIKLRRDTQRTTKSWFPFEYPKARTESYSNSIVPWGIRFLRDGRENIYKTASERSRQKMPCSTQH